MMACAGNSDLAASAYQKALKQVWNSSPKNALDRLADALEEYYRRHVFGHPLFHESPDDFAYNFLLGVRLNGDHGRLFATYETAFREVSTFEAAGCGAEVARPLIGLLFEKQMGESYAIAMAAHTLHYIKKTVDGCGGPTVLRVLRDDGTTEDLTNAYPIKHIENVSNFFCVQAAKLILRHTEGTTEDLKTKLTHLNALAFEYRDWWEKAASREAGADPESPTHDPSPPQPSPE